MGNLVGALLFGSLAVSGLAHALTGTLLLVIALLSGMSSTVVSPALSAAVRTVVPGSQRAQASAYASGRADAVSLIAPPAGGALIPLSYGIPFLADAVSYVVAAASVLLVRHPLTARSGRDGLSGSRWARASPSWAGTPRSWPSSSGPPPSIWACPR